MTNDNIESRIQAAADEAKELRKKIKENVESKAETSCVYFFLFFSLFIYFYIVVNKSNCDYFTVNTFTKDIQKIEKCSMKCRRVLRGHLGKVYCIHWASEKSNIVSASQDGKMLVWDAMTTNKISIIKLRCAWAMTCAYSPSGNFVASGGLDNICSVYHLDSENVTEPVVELVGHTGYLSCCRFLNDRQMLTCSGDGTCALWDIARSVKITEFNDHQADVMGFVDRIIIFNILSQHYINIYLFIHCYLVSLLHLIKNHLYQEVVITIVFFGTFKLENQNLLLQVMFKILIVLSLYSFFFFFN